MKKPVIGIQEKHCNKKFVKEFLSWWIDQEHTYIELSSYGEFNQYYELVIENVNHDPIFFDDDCTAAFVKIYERDEKLNELLNDK